MVERVTRYRADDGLDYATLEEAVQADKTQYLIETISAILEDVWYRGIDQDEVVNALLERKHDLHDALTYRHKEEPIK